MLRLLVVVCVISLYRAEYQFHRDLDESDMLHYFGTRMVEKVPLYDVVGVREMRQKRDVGSLHVRQFHLNAFGEDYHLHLQRNTDLLSSGCLVHRLQANGTSRTHPCVQQEADHCYYHGYVREHEKSNVAVSTCNGLHGIITTDKHDIIVQPVKETHAQRMRKQSNLKAPFIVYKKVTRRDTCRELGTGAGFNSMRMYTRKRRSTRGRKYAELMITVDTKMFEYHGEDVQRYTLTALNIAAQAYIDGSLGHEIVLSLVKFVVLEHDQLNLEVTSDASYTLNSFCTWQESRNPVSDSNPEHYDGAALITRLNIHKNGYEGLLGIAKFGGFCSKYSRCTYSEDSGLDLGLTLAHETGHNLGIGHDGDGNACPNNQFLMATDGGSGSGAFQWSKCSAAYLEAFLSQGRSECLNDPPRSLAVKMVQEKPGTIYNGDAQCRFFKGADSSVCIIPGKDACVELWCYDPDRPGMCLTNNFPKMDGTACGAGRWCIRGQCVEYGTEGPMAVNGGWTEWDDEWSACSRSCGGGVRMRTRSCSNPRPAYGGRHCSGSDVMAEMCNPQECASTQYDFIAEQCAQTNDKPLRGILHEWMPYMSNGGYQCEMLCQSRRHRIIATRGRNFMDGTECSADEELTYQRCIQGTCRAFGCDGKLDSGRVLDRCGVCNGDGSTCSLTNGRHNTGKKHEYVTFVTVPRGSVNVGVTNANSFCHMAVAVYGDRIFNTDGTRVDSSGTYSKHGVTVKYTKDPESIVISSQLNVDVQIQVWKDYGDNYVGVDPEIEYKYYAYSARPVTSTYDWKVVKSHCSKTCGTGFERSFISCIRKDDGTPVEDHLCDFNNQPNVGSTPCNTHACPARWRTGAFSACSQSCGGGVMRREVLCVRINEDVEDVVPDRQCSNLVRPADAAECNPDSCPGEWRAGQWSECSRTCGRGYKTRQITCHKDSQSELVVGDHVCSSHYKPTPQEECIVRACSEEGVCKDIETDCGGYSDSVCTDYGDWAKVNCAMFCGLCKTGDEDAITTVTVAAENDCADVLTDCAEYQADMCSTFGAWAKQNCQKFCGLCPDVAVVTQPTIFGTPGAETCVDTVDDCMAYGSNVCTDYKSWADTNCPKHCGLCSGSGNTEATTMTTSATKILTTIATTTMATTSSQEACRDLIDDCGAYGSDVCTAYGGWSKINCQKHCHFCRVSACKDEVNNCADYGGDMCTNYGTWAKEKCQRFCNFC